VINVPVFRIRKEESTTNKTLRFPNSLLTRAMRTAHDNNISFNKLIVQSLEFALDNIQSETKAKSQPRNRKRKPE
jgi:hypothetical protein